MPRTARLIVKEEAAIYHVMSHTALDGFVLKEAEKEYLLSLIKRLSSIFFTEILGFCIMGNHFHLVVRMLPDDGFSDEQIANRYQSYYGKGFSKPRLLPGQIPYYRHRWACLSCFMKAIKQQFSCYYNKLHRRRGYFWGDRFKSVIVEDGQTLINCLAYVDLNPVRASLVDKPEDYRWCSLGYHIQSKNSGKLLSFNFGLEDSGYSNDEERLNVYRRFVYNKGEIGGLDVNSSGSKLSKTQYFRYRWRYFTDSGIIGTKAFVYNCYQSLKRPLAASPKAEPQAISGLAQIYCLKRLPKEA